MNYYAMVDAASRQPFNVLVVSRGRYIAFNRQSKKWWDTPNGPSYFRGEADDDIEPATKDDAERIAKSIGADLAGAAALLKG